MLGLSRIERPSQPCTPPKARYQKLDRLATSTVNTCEPELVFSTP
jgi:hypothetical protein